MVLVILACSKSSNNLQLCLLILKEEALGIEHTVRYMSKSYFKMLSCCIDSYIACTYSPVLFSGYLPISAVFDAPARQLLSSRNPANPGALNTAPTGKSHQISHDPYGPYIAVLIASCSLRGNNLQRQESRNCQQPNPAHPSLSCHNPSEVALWVF